MGSLFSRKKPKTWRERMTLHQRPADEKEVEIVEQDIERQREADEAEVQRIERDTEQKDKDKGNDD